MSDLSKESKKPSSVAQPDGVATPTHDAHHDVAKPLQTVAAHVSDHTLAAAVDALAYPMMALQNDGVLLHANKAALDVLGAAQVFVLSTAGHVTPKMPTRRAEFAAALQAAAAGHIQQLSWLEGQTTVHASVRLLATAAEGTAAPLLLLMMAPPADAIFDASGFAASYKLSPAETRVLEALMHGNHAEGTAKRLGVGVATVRSQIASIRKKTQHDSVAALLAMLGDLPPLLRMETAPGATKPKRKKATKAPLKADPPNGATGE